MMRIRPEGFLPGSRSLLRIVRLFENGNEEVCEPLPDTFLLFWCELIEIAFSSKDGVFQSFSLALLFHILRRLMSGQETRLEAEDDKLS